MFGEWENFFITIAGVAVTAFSVLFVTLQIKSDHWKSSPLKQWVAAAALTELFVPLIASVISLMPAHPWRIASWITGALGLTVIVIHVLLYLRHRQAADRFDRIQVTTGVAVSGLIYTGVLVAGCIPATAGLYLLGSICIWLLFSGASEAWLLLEPGGVART